MKTAKRMLSCALILCGLIGMIACLVASLVFSWQNPDMTEMRRFLDYPWPTVWAIVDYVGIQIGLWMVKNK
jgi:hypothetical protein